MGRYLMYCSYIGTHFSGSQRLLKLPAQETQSVQGAIEKALGDIFHKWEVPRISMSSRTDSGTHALVNTAHMDLNFKGIPPNNIIIHQLNKRLRKFRVHDLRINSIQRVRDSFHCRSNVRSRTYMYRLGVVKGAVNGATYPHHFEHLLPMSELGRIGVVGSLFNPEVFRMVLQMYCGEHDFATFMGSPANCETGINTVKKLSAWMEPGKPLLDPSTSPICRNLEAYYHVYFVSRSFLYRQIRRLMGAAIGVAEGRMSFDQIRYMLTNPGQGSWDSNFRLSPACGLYLSDVVYNSQDTEEYIDEERLSNLQKEDDVRCA